MVGIDLEKPNCISPNVVTKFVKEKEKEYSLVVEEIEQVKGSFTPTFWG